jgi:CspA family cold shock protein
MGVAREYVVVGESRLRRYGAVSRLPEVFVVMRGQIAKLKPDRGFGFIRPDDGSKELFFHRSSVADDGYDQLSEGQSVDFETQESPKGPRANNVRPA